MNWPRLPLSELLVQRFDTVEVERDREYPMVGVRGFGRGLYFREVLAGSGTSYDSFYRVHAGDLVMSRVKAWEGAVAVVPEELAGHFVSKEFPCFHPADDRILTTFIWYFFRSAEGIDQLRRATSGLGARRERVREGAFLGVEVPVPRMDEQLRIVARIAHLNGKFEELHALREGLRAPYQNLVAAEEMQIWPTSALSRVPRLVDITSFLARGRESQQGESDHRLIKTQHVQMDRLLASDMTLAPWVAAKVPLEARIKPGDILIACSAAGCLGRVARADGAFAGDASTDTHVAIARADVEKVEPDYLYAYLLGAQGQHQLRSRERGDWKREKVGFRLTELNLSDLKLVPVPIPGRQEQRQIVKRLGALRAKIAEVRQHAEGQLAVLESLPHAILRAAFSGDL